jgi:hypothetical protein
MQLPRPARGYDANNEAQARDAIIRADAENYKRGRDVELAPGQRLILRSAGGTRWKIEVDVAGLLSLTPLGAPALMITAAEALPAGSLCNVFTSSGVAAIRLASAADASRAANAFVRAAVALGGETAPGYVGQADAALSGLTPGTTYYLSTTPGAVSTSPPSATGNVVQEVGVALSAGVLLFAPKLSVQL